MSLEKGYLVCFATSHQFAATKAQCRFKAVSRKTVGVVDGVLLSAGRERYWWCSQKTGVAFSSLKPNFQFFPGYISSLEKRF